jgi:hypothetical protein
MSYSDESGIELLKTDNIVAEAFMLANKAMLLQQLHYKLPLTEYSSFDKTKLQLVLESR